MKRTPFLLLFHILFLISCYPKNTITPDHATLSTRETPQPIRILPPEQLSAQPTKVASSARVNPTLTPLPFKKLTFCTVDSVYPGYTYFNWWWAQQEFLNAVAPNPIRIGPDFEYHPTILVKLPSFAEGDAMFESVSVRAGDKIVNDTGVVVSLQQGVIYKPSGCRDKTCVTTYSDGEVRMDRIVVTFRLLPNLKWSDGEPLVAQDSVYAYEVTQQPEFQNEGCASCGLPFGADLPEYTAGYLALDEQTVQWISLPGYLSRWYFLNFFSPLPQHLLKDKALSEIDMLYSSDHKMPVWGPFMVEEWVQEESLRVVRNPYYFRASEELPYLDEIVWRFLKPETGVGLASVLTSECDIVSHDATIRETLWWNGLEIYRGIQKNGNLRVNLTLISWEGIAFNLDVPADRPDFFSDIRVRQAIIYGTDRKAIAEAVVGPLCL